MSIKVIKAERKHKDFLVHSNNVINDVSDMNNTNLFANNFL